MPSSKSCGLFMLRARPAFAHLQQWLHESGTDYPLIKGGYKALRQAVIQLTEELVQNRSS